MDNCSLHEKTQEDQIINTIKLFNYQLFYEDFTSNDFLWIEIPLIIGSFRSLFARSFSDIVKIGQKSESFRVTRRQLDKRRIWVF